VGNKTDKEKDVALENKLTHKHTILHCADFYRSKATKELIFFPVYFNLLLFSSLLSEWRGCSGDECGYTEAVILLSCNA